MNARGDGSTGWSRAWKICIWARLHDGNHTYKILNGMLREQIANNLFDMHPPFQIDGNFGYAAGICEMLVQSHMGEIQLLPALPALPALPDAWPDGYVKGIRARGAFDLDVHWNDGQLTNAVVRSEKGGVCKIRASTPVVVTCLDQRIAATEAGKQVVTFPTRQGQDYLVTPRED